MSTGFFQFPQDTNTVEPVSNQSGFFYGEAVPPAADSTEALISDLTSQVQQVTTANTQAQAAATAATSAASNAALAETNVSTLAQQATTTLNQANTAISQANTAVANASAAVASTNAAVTATGNSQAAAASSASAAAASQTAAAGSASPASSSQSAAASSASSAAANATSVAAALASMNAIWLGAKTADPTLDNNGNSLTIGAEYLNTTRNPPTIRVYTSGGWADQDQTAETASSNATLAASQASTSATNASNSANAAATSATNAANSASAAATSASSASTSSSSASTSATNAANSASSAATTAANINALLNLPITSTAMTLNNTQFLNGIIECTGALTGNTTITVPATSHPFMLVNNTTGAYTLTVQMSGGSQSATVVQGYAGNLCCDGINGVYAASSAGGNANAQLVNTTPTAGTTFIPFAHVPGFAWLMLRGVFLVMGTDYTDSSSGFTLQGFSADGTESFQIFSLNTVSIANAMTAASPVISSGPLQFADGSQQSTAPMGRNRIINGACQVQVRPSRVHSAAVAGYSVVDRMNTSNQASGQFTQSGGTITYQGVVYPAVVQQVNTACTSFSGGNYWFGVYQIIEGYNCYDLVSKPTTVSFLFNASQTGTYPVCIRDSSSAYSYVTTFNYTNSGVTQRVVVNIPAPPAGATYPRTNGVGMSVIVGFQNTGTYQAPSINAWNAGNYLSAAGCVQWGLVANAFISVTNLQLEAGTIQNPVFEVIDLGLEYLRCQRYFETGWWRMIYNASVTGYWGSTTTIYKASKRSTPAISVNVTGNNNGTYQAAYTTSEYIIVASTASAPTGAVDMSGSFTSDCDF